MLLAMDALGLSRAARNDEAKEFVRREADLVAWESRLQDKEAALSALEEAMQQLKMEVLATQNIDSSKEAPDVPTTLEASPRRRLYRKSCGRLRHLSLSPRKRSPAKARRQRVKQTSNRGMLDTAAEEEPGSGIAVSSSNISASTPFPLTPDEPASGCPDSLLGAFPLPMTIDAWDWPLSRSEKKMLVLMFDRNELRSQQRDLAGKLEGIRTCMRESLRAL